MLPEGVIYLDGNSLGALPSAAPDRLADVAEQQWGEDLITSWNKHGWIDWPTRIAAKLAPIVGAKPSELLIADSTSVCLFKLLAAAVRARPGRTTILTQKRNFPTDLYVAQGLADMLGLELKAVAAGRSRGCDRRGHCGRHADPRRLPHGAFHDMARHQRARSRRRRADGLGPVAQRRSDAARPQGAGCDLAVGCGYKYLNGGPGRARPSFTSPSGLQDELRSPLQGWMGHADAFAFDDDYRPAPGILQLPDRHAVDPCARRARRGARRPSTASSMRDVEAKGAALVATVHRRSRSALRRRGAARIARATPRSAAAMSSSPTRTAMRSCRR